MKWIKGLKERSKSKKGASVLEFAFGLLTFVLLFAFTVDVVMIATKQNTVSQTANQVVRQIAIQGGVKPNAPKNYPGGNQAYMDSREMTSMMRERMNDTGIGNSDWSMKIVAFNPSGQPVKSQGLSNGTNIEVDYQDMFEFEITYKYNWIIMGQLLPPMKEKITSVQKRSSVSEYKYFTR